MIIMRVMLFFIFVAFFLFIAYKIGEWFGRPPMKAGVRKAGEWHDEYEKKFE